MTTLMQDLRFGARMLAKNPVFTIIAVLTLAIGIGANTAIFSVVNAVLIQPLPYKQPGRLVQLYTRFPAMDFDRFWFSAPELLDLEQEAQSFSAIGGWVNSDVNINGADEPLRLTGCVGTSGLSAVIGVEPARGRWFTHEETVPGAPDVVLIAHDLWQSAFGGDPEIIGRVIRVDGTPTEIIGIMAPGFEFPAPDIDMWFPLTIDPANPGGRGSHFLSVIARLRSGVTFDQARAELDRLTIHWETAHANNHPIHRQNHPIAMYRLVDEMVGDIRPTMYLLLGAVGFVLLIACVNVANLLLARAEVRQKEIAIRTALGAGRGRLLRQFLTESVLLALLGGALGTVLALWGVDAIIAANPDSIPRAAEIGVDGTVLAFAVGVSLLTGIAFGLAPLAHTGVRSLAGALKAAGQHATAARAQQRFRRALVVVEVAAAVVLVIGAGLMIRSFLRLQQVDPGFDAENLLTCQIALPGSAYPEDHQILDFWRRLQERLEAVPGAASVSLVTGLPPERRINANDIAFEGLERDPNGPVWNVDYWQTVGDDYFGAMGIRLVDGRRFSDADSAESMPVVVVNETMAGRFWPGGSAVGQRLQARPWAPDSGFQTIVGVVADVKQRGVDQPAGTEVYFPLAQTPTSTGGAPRTMNIVLRAPGGPLDLVGSVRGIVRQLDPALPLANVQTMDDVFYVAVARPRLLMLLLSLFAAAALLLATVGIYGVMSYSVVQRTNEIGIRMALGAERGHIFTLVLARGLVLTGIGIAVGLGGAYALTRVLESWLYELLYEVESTDPATFAAVAAAIVITAALACYLPARRATRVEPMRALRYE